MKTFLGFLQEETVKKHGLFAFDVDDTLFHTTAKVRVMHGKKHLQSLSNSEYNTHELPNGHHYDFSEFRSAEKFAKESKPNHHVLDKMKAIHAGVQKKGGKVIINTARADFDDKDKFLGKFRHHGVDIDNIHVYRAGNDTGPGTVAEKKAAVVRRHIDTGKYSHATLYDDSEHNLNHFLALGKQFPSVKFNAHHVLPNGRSRKYTE